MSWNGVKKQSNIENIKAWCEDMCIENYTIDSQGKIDVDGGVDLANKDFEELPYKFGEVNGNFVLDNCKNLITLKNCPDHILYKHMFDIEGCSKLDSLEGFPKIVEGTVYCSKCKRKFTEEQVRSLCKVKGNIYN